MKVAVPGRRSYEIETVVLDMNGTIGLDGELLGGVEEGLTWLRGQMEVVIITADTHGGADGLMRRLGLNTVVLGEGHEELQKLELIRRLDQSARLPSVTVQTTPSCSRSAWSKTCGTPSICCSSLSDWWQRFVFSEGLG